MAVSWHFHIQAWPGYSLPKSIEKMFQKFGFSCRFGCFFDVSVSFLAICQTHAGFIALSCSFYTLIFRYYSWKNPNQQLDSSQNLPLAWMSDSSQIHRGFMSLSCQFHSYVRFIVDSCHFQPQTGLQWQIHGTLMALSLKLMKVTWIWHEHGIPNFDNLEFKRKCMKVTWIWFSEFWQFRRFRESAMKTAWKWLEPCFWGCHESDMNMAWIMMI